MFMNVYDVFLAGIQLRLDTWLIRCDSLISCVIAWACSSRFIAWFRFCPPLVEPLLLMLWTCLTQGAPQPAELDSMVGGVVWRGMACHVRLEGEPLMDCLSRQDALCQRIQLHLSLRLEIGLRIVWEDFSECKCLVGCLRLLLFASWISRCQCKHIWRCSRDFCLIQVAVCRSSKLRP